MSWHPDTEDLPEALHELLRSFGNSGGTSGTTVAEYVDTVVGSMEERDNPDDVYKFALECLDDLILDIKSMKRKVSSLLPSNEDPQNENERFINEHIGQDAILEGEELTEVVTMAFNHEEARGTIAMERGEYGIWVWVDGKNIALIDLFHNSESEDGEKYTQVAINDGQADTAAFVRFKQDRIEFLRDYRGTPIWIHECSREEETPSHQDL